MKLSEFRASYARDRCDVERKAFFDVQPPEFRAACAVLDSLMSRPGFVDWWNSVDRDAQDEVFGGIAAAVEGAQS